MTSESVAVTEIVERALLVRSESVHRVGSRGLVEIAAQLVRRFRRRGMGALCRVAITHRGLACRSTLAQTLTPD
jgi:hypothetical protein